MYKSVRKSAVTQSRKSVKSTIMDAALSRSDDEKSAEEEAKRLEQWSAESTDQLGSWISRLSRKRKQEEQRNESRVSEGLAHRFVDPSLFRESPIVARQTAASRTLNRTVHDWIWSSKNRWNCRQHRVSVYASMLKRLAANANDTTSDESGGGRDGNVAAGEKQQPGKALSSSSSSRQQQGNAATPTSTPPPPRTAYQREQYRITAEQLESLTSFLQKRSENIQFNELEHKYLVNEQEIERNVTTALEELFGTFDADHTIVRMLKNKSRWKRSKYYAACNFDDYGNELSEEQIGERLKRTWEEKRDQGSRLHSYIEQQYGSSLGITEAAATAATTKNGSASNAKTSVTSAEETEAAAAAAAAAAATHGKTATVSDEAATAATTTLPQIQQSDLAAFESWEQIRMFNDWLLLASEYRVYDLECGIAGTVDAIYLPNVKYPRQVVLVDWKRATIQTTVGNMFYEHPLMTRYAKGNYWKYAMQLNIYREILEKSYGLHVIDMFIVSFPDDQLKCEVFGVPKMLEAKTYMNALKRRVTLARDGNYAAPAEA